MFFVFRWLGGLVRWSSSNNRSSSDWRLCKSGAHGEGGGDNSGDQFFHAKSSFRILSIDIFYVVP